MVVRLKHFGDFFRHSGWVFGLVKTTPYFDRWSWWEEFDY